MQNCNVNKTICIFPRFQGDNEYLLNLSLILENNFSDVRFVALSPKTMLKMLLKGKRSDVLILNWLEDYPCLKKGFLAEARETLRVILGMVIAYIYYRKIIWVRHNYKPHLAHSKFCYRILCGAISFFSDNIVTHRRVHEFDSQVIFHPLYKKTEVNTIAPFDCLIFGNIKPYKNVPMILQDWDPKRELKIIGKCKSADLNNEITTLIKGRLPKVIYENRFMEVEELNGFLSSVTFVILAHEEASMIVSGTFYHAISYGANVVLKDSEYGRSIKSEFPLVHLVKNFEGEALSNLVPFAREKIIALAGHTYSDSVIADQWSRLLAD
ncbi:hypothetical protein [Paraglaciecola sp. L1A13]|uniref:hypothetical protein n=1 Tax=Paraglaciecola sp. L1A13 TaxID=2686359 RepID=UPI00131ADE4E|nr:hypothetical protein [Paraglaciecola sp. L1A13]